MIIHKPLIPTQWKSLHTWPLYRVLTINILNQWHIWKEHTDQVVFSAVPHNLSSQTVFSSLDNPISVDEIQLVINHFSNHKSAGRIDIQARISSASISCVCFFGNKYFSYMAQFHLHSPTDWGKWCRPSKPFGVWKHFFAICCDKVFVQSWIIDYLQTNNLLVVQNGFWQGPSIYNLVESSIISCLQTFACFIDFVRHLTPPHGLTLEEANQLGCQTGLCFISYLVWHVH